MCLCSGHLWESLGKAQVLEKCPNVRGSLYTSLCSWDADNCSLQRAVLDSVWPLLMRLHCSIRTFLLLSGLELFLLTIAIFPLLLQVSVPKLWGGGVVTRHMVLREAAGEREAGAGQEWEPLPWAVTIPGIHSNTHVLCVVLM